MRLSWIRVALSLMAGVLRRRGENVEMHRERKAM